MSNSRATCQICLVIDGAESSVDRLRGALRASSIASVLVRVTGNVAISPALVKQLVQVAQKHGAAALIEDDAALARTLGADGVHLTPSDTPLEKLYSARQMLSKDSIVGVDCGGSRHLAMEAGEAGADYIAFSKVRVTLPPLTDDETETDLTTELSTAELVQWWSEIFEVPCVALDADGEAEQRQFIEAGADFLGVALPSGQSLHAAADMLRWTGDLIARSKTRS